MQVEHKGEGGVREKVRWKVRVTHMYSPTLVDPPPCSSPRLTPRVRFRVMVISSINDSVTMHWFIVSVVYRVGLGSTVTTMVKVRVRRRVRRFTPKLG